MGGGVERVAGAGGRGVRARGQVSHITQAQAVGPCTMDRLAPVATRSARVKDRRTIDAQGSADAR
jgi:hypothetical protein